MVLMQVVEVAAEVVVTANTVDQDLVADTARAQAQAKLHKMDTMVMVGHPVLAVLVLVVVLDKPVVIGHPMVMGPAVVRAMALALLITTTMDHMQMQMLVAMVVVMVKANMVAVALAQVLDRDTVTPTLNFLRKGNSRNEPNTPLFVVMSTMYNLFSFICTCFMCCATRNKGLH
jgi:hypothetical protein